MLPSIWEDIAREREFSAADKQIFGWLKGFYITLSLVPGAIRLHVFLPPDPVAQHMEISPREQRKAAYQREEAAQALETAVKAHGFTCLSASSGERFAAVEFKGKTRATRELGELLDDVVLRFAAIGLPRRRVCMRCQMRLDSPGVPVRIKEDVFPMHEYCAQDAVQTLPPGEGRKQGSLPMGILGALLAAIVGAIPWALTYSLGYVATAAGLLIGVIVGKGYALLHGRQGRARIAVILLFALFAVILGQACGMTIQLSDYYSDQLSKLTGLQTMKYTRAQAIMLFWTTDLWASSRMVWEAALHLFMCTVFTLWSCVGLMRKSVRETVSERPRRLTPPVA
jgi:hypothetical protein